jgi:hypothetical protein
LVVATPDDSRVRPSFFPATIVWAAIFSDVFGTRYAGGYSTIFCGLAVWAVWIVSRRRLGATGASAVAILAAANGAAYYIARMPLSEPLTWFFAWAAFAAFDAWEDDGFSADGLVAGLMFGALSIVRPEFALFTTTALCARRLFSFSLGGRPLGPSFAVGLVATSAATLLEIRFLGGAYLAPLEEAARAIGWHASSWQQAAPLTSQVAAIAALVVACVAVVAAVRRIGFLKTISLAVTLGAIGVYCIESTPRPGRSLTWLVSFLGYVAPLLALPGIVVAWKQRGEIRGNSFLLVVSLLVGGLLIYNTHVNPALPWAIRRFVPIVVPAIILLAGMSCAVAYRRSMILGLACWLAVFTTVLAPARALWGQEFYSGTSRQLHEFVAELPKDGVYLIDIRLAPLLLGIPLWLLYDIDNLPADTSTKYRRRILAQTIEQLRPHRALYYLRPTPCAYDPLGAYNRELITDYTFQFWLPEQTTARMPTARQDYTTTVSVFRLGSRKPAATRFVAP